MPPPDMPAASPAALTAASDLLSPFSFIEHLTMLMPPPAAAAIGVAGPLHRLPGASGPAVVHAVPRHPAVLQTNRMRKWRHATGSCSTARQRRARCGCRWAMQPLCSCNCVRLQTAAFGEAMFS